MTEWREAYSGIEPKPEAIDTTSSPTTVYLRKDFEEVDVPSAGMEEEGSEPTKQWKYQERTCTPEEYAIATLSAEQIQLRHEGDIIDEYTMELMEEGLL